MQGRIAFGLLALLATTGFALEGELQIAGSTTVQPLAEVLAEAFMDIHGDVVVYVQGGGSSAGVTAAVDGTADIGNASRAIKDSEIENCPSLQIYTIAMDGIAIATDPGNSVGELSLDDVKGIFAGEITNWSEVGGPDEYITVVAREEGSGTRAAFEELVMEEEGLITMDAILLPSNGAVRTTVSTTPYSIGFLSFGYLDDQTRPVAVDGVLPTVENAAGGVYPVIRPLNMVTKGEPGAIAGAFLDYVMSEGGQAIVADEGYIPVN